MWARGTPGARSWSRSDGNIDQELALKAIVREEYGSPDVLELKEIEKPVPGDDEVLVKVHAASVNTADLDYLRGRPAAARVASGIGRPRNYRMGLDVAGRVEAVGRDVTTLKVGEDVWADLFDFGQGTFAEYVCAPQVAFTRMPSGVTFEQAATVPHSGVLALQGLLGFGDISPGDTVLINGAGGCVGPFAIQLAKSFGADVTAVDHGGKFDLMRSAGADHLIDYTREDFTANGRSYDLILDIVDEHSVLHYRHSLAPGGRYVLVARRLTGFAQAFLLGAGVSMTSNRRMGTFMWRANRSADLDLIKALLESGKVTPIIDRQFQLSEVPEALRYQEEGHARGKVVITV
jgi:NADPH:quinone reductase-like Zn-dependent oxidoreductase